MTQTENPCSVGIESTVSAKGRRKMSRRSGQVGQVFLRCGRWVGRYYVDTAERRIRKSVVLGLKEELTKPEARRNLLNLLTAEGINTPTYLERALGTAKTFSEVAELWERNRLPKLGLSSQYMNPKLIARHLIPFFGKLALDGIKTGTINEWISTSMKGFEPKTVHNMYKLFRAIVNWHYRQQDEQPKKWSPDLPPLRDEEQRWFSPEETTRLVNAASGQYKTLFHLAASTGCRAGELFGLHAEDIDLERQVIRVIRSIWKGREVPTKTRKGFREVFIDLGTIAVLKAHLAGRVVGRVFQTRNGTPLDDTEVVQGVLYPLCDALGIPRGGLHAFRHGRVSLMRASGCPDDVVKRQIGHSSLRTTSGYTHFSEDFQRNLAERLSWTQNAKLDSVQIAVSSNQIN